MGVRTAFAGVRRSLYASASSMRAWSGRARTANDPHGRSSRRCVTTSQGHRFTTGTINASMAITSMAGSSRASRPTHTTTICLESLCRGPPYFGRIVDPADTFTTCQRTSKIDSRCVLSAACRSSSQLHQLPTPSPDDTAAAVWGIRPHDTPRIRRSAAAAWTC